MPILKKPKTEQPRRRAGDQPHPIRTAVTSIGSVAVVIGAVYLIEDRYAHAGDVQQLRGAIEAQGKDTRTALEINRLTAEVATLRIQGALVEQRVDSLSARPTLSPAERTTLDRYRAQAAVYEAEVAAKQRLIDRLKAGR